MAAGITNIFLAGSILLLIISVGVALYKEYKKAEELEELKKSYIAGYEKTANDIQKNSKKSGSKTTTGTAGTDNDDACANYKDNSTNLSESCIQKLWSGAGCTTEDMDFNTDAYRKKNYKQLKKDFDKISKSKTAYDKDQCYQNSSNDQGLTIRSGIGNKLTKMTVKGITDFVFRKVATKLLNRYMGNALFKSSIKGLMITSRVFTRMGMKLGIDGLKRLGLNAGAKAAQKQLTKGAVKASGKASTKIAAKGAASLGAKMTAKYTMAASTGPAAPFVAAAMFAFDLLSMGLDMGDAGGYQKMQTKEVYVKMKKELDNEMRKTFEDGKESPDSIVWPAIVGPLDKIDQEEYEVQLEKEIKKILDRDNNHPAMKRIIEAIEKDVANKKLSEKDSEDDTKLQKYMEMIDMDEIYDAAFANICKLHDGKLINKAPSDKPKQMQCSYKDKQSCDKSYAWPPNEDTNYAEFKSDQYGGACVSASFAIRGLCETNHLPYDEKTGICKIDENYCKMKGADYRFNKKINDYDCSLNTGQFISEMIFGTTITRGLKQIFDPAQYEKCKPGEIDDGYFCRKVQCKEDQEMDKAKGLCYPKCKPNYTSNDITMCLEDCPRIGPMKINEKCIDTSGVAKNTPLHKKNDSKEKNLKVKDCDSNQSTQSYVFNAKSGQISMFLEDSICLQRAEEKGKKDKIRLYVCDNNSENQKFIFDSKTDQIKLKSDPSKCFTNNKSLLELHKCNVKDLNQKVQFKRAHNDGLTCSINTTSKLASCKDDGYANTGATCFREDHTYSNPSQLMSCPAGYMNSASSCLFDAFGRGAGFDYFFRNGMNNCEKKHGKGNCEKSGAIAYPKCQYLAQQKGYKYADQWTPDGCCMCSPRKGYRELSFESEGICPEGMEKGKGIGKSRCYKPCKPGYTWTGEFCQRYASTKSLISEGSWDKFMKCDKGEYLKGARCYPKVPKGFKDVLEFASYSKHTYDRGVGKPAAIIYPKKRLVPYSTKNN